MIYQVLFFTGLGIGVLLLVRGMLFDAHVDSDADYVAPDASSFSPPPD